MSRTDRHHHRRHCRRRHCHRRRSPAGRHGCARPVGTVLAVVVGVGTALAAAGVVAAAPAAEEMFVLTGRVAPAAGAVPREARVEVLPALGREARGRVDLRQLATPEPVVTAKPGRDGRYRLEVPGRGMWVVRVTAPGHLPVELHRMPLIDDQELPPAPLLPDAGLAVEVVDEAGTPVPGARVGVLPDLDGLLWREAGEEGWRPVRRLLTTDRDGRLRMPWAVGEAGSLRAYRLGGTEGPAVTTRGEPVRLVVPSSLDRFLRLRRTNGGPLPDFGVRVGEWRWRAATTDEEGWALVAAPREGGPFTIESPEGWRLDLELAPVGPPGGEGFPLSEEGPSALAEAAPAVPVHLEVQVEVPLPPPVTVVGRVMSRETGAPVESAMVWLEDRPRDPVWTDRHGRFRLELAPGRASARVLATAEGHHAWGRSGWPAGEDLVITLDPARRLEGRTVDAVGEPVAGARVWLRPRSFRGSWDEGRKMERTSGLDGRFDFGLRRANRDYEVRASAPGLASRVETWDPLQEPTRELVLRAPARAAGRVVAPDGTGLAGARIQLYRDRQVEGPQQVADIELEATSDAEGRFLLSPVPAGTFLLEVQREGSAGRLLQGLEPVEGDVLELGEIVLEPGVAVAGRVVDDRGEPVAGAEVTARMPTGQGGGRWLVGRRVVQMVTGEEGRFRMEDLHAGTRYTLVAAVGPYRRNELERVEAPAEDLQLVLPAGVVVHGEVVDGAGAPLPGAEVGLVIEQEATQDRGRSARSLHHRADPRGRFRLEHIPPGDTRIRAHKGDRISLQEVRLTTEGGQEYGPLQLVVEEGAVVTGVVTDTRGQPVGSAHVNLTPTEIAAREPSEITNHARTGPDGSYQMHGAVPGPVSITVVQGGYRILETTADLAPGPQRLDLVVEDQSRIRGRVTDTEGRGIEGAAVRASVWRGQEADSHRVHSDAQGEFSITGAQAGQLELRVSAPRFSPAIRGPMEFDGFLLDGLEIVLEPGTVLEGQISGVPPEDRSRISVTAFFLGRDGSTSGPFWPHEHHGVVRYDGSYEISSLGPGTWAVEATLDTDQRKTSDTVEIAPGQRRARLDLELEKGFTLAGRVWLNGEPLTGGVVLVEDSSSSRDTRTNHEGRFRLAGLVDGPHELTVVVAHRYREVRTLEIWADREVEIHLRLARLSGRVLGFDGQPVMGAQVRLHRESTLDGTATTAAGTGADRPNLAFSDRQARFSYTHLPEGRYRLVVDGRAQGRLESTIEVRAPKVSLGDLMLEPRVGQDGADGVPEAGGAL